MFCLPPNEPFNFQIIWLFFNNFAFNLGQIQKENVILKSKVKTVCFENPSETRSIFSAEQYGK